MFSKKIGLSSLTITSVPKTDLSFNLGGTKTSVFIYPVNNWKYNTSYTITVSVQSETGESLDSSVEYKFTPKEVTNSSLNESNFR